MEKEVDRLGRIVVMGVKALGKDQFLRLLIVWMRFQPI
jgi:flagellar hook assembly protein FlgD